MTLMGISAGEVSGDRYGALLATAIQRLDPTITFEGMGHVAMQQAGVRCHVDIATHSSIGVLDVIRSLPAVLGGIWRMVRWIKRTPSMTALILIDCQGVNMVLARVAKRQGIPVIYFIAPQEWQWGTDSGGSQVVRYTDLLLTIFQEETEFYRRLGGRVVWVGHPVYELSNSHLPQQGGHSLILAVFPGSRIQEITLTFPVLLDAAIRLLKRGVIHQIVVSVATPLLKHRIESVVARYGVPVLYWERSSDELIRQATLSLASSGSVTLQHAVLGTPCVVGYRFGRWSYRVAQWVLGKRRDRIPFMALPNLLLNEEMMPEFFQERCRVEDIEASALQMITDAGVRDRLLLGYQRVRNQLGESGAIDRAARAIVAKAWL